MTLSLPSKPKELVRRWFSDTVANHMILSGPLRGARIVTSWHDYPGAILGTTERSLLGWFEEHVLQGETWLDVGAHYGYTAIALSRLVGSRGRVFAFEPVRATAAALAETRIANQLFHLTVVPIALSERPSRSFFQLPKVRGMADSTIDVASSYEAVATTSLDSAWPEIGGEEARVDGVKIDVQGMELSVLAGMRCVLATWRPKLIVEFHRGVARGPVLELLTSLGYSTAVDPVDVTVPAKRFADDQSYYFQPLC